MLVSLRVGVGGPLNRMTETAAGPSVKREDVVHLFATVRLYFLRGWTTRHPLAN
jgi:hypothetical protein